MDLSVIIVNYNVRYFLEQTLLSVERAVANLKAEVWVVDNHSSDGSVEMVRERFPWVRLIANDDNPGFAVANNQAIRQAAGRYVLLLNPDTVVAEDTFSCCLDFADRHSDCGGLGVRMIDGSGRFLPESKRGLPTPWVAFTKAFGLARLFPRSRRFGRYHLGYLSDRETHRVEVLSGAFMWMRRSTLEKVGLLDEDFFMYGEDIDLSYRITEGGYSNYYFPEATIIHYKGESTKRGSLNYVRVFYQAMIIFANKHFVGSRGRALVGLMKAAVYLRAAMTVVANLWQRLRYPLLEGIGIYVGLRVLKNLWANYHFSDPGYFSEELHYLHFPAYTLFWVGSIYLNGGYDRPFELGRTLRSLGVGTLGLFALYGLLPESLRPSRALLLLGAAWAVSWILLVRGVSHLLGYGHLDFRQRREDRLLVVGSEGEAERALGLLHRAGAARNYLGRVDVPDEGGAGVIGRSEDLPGLAKLYRAREVLFCLSDLRVGQVIGWMDSMGPAFRYRMLPAASDSLIGSYRSQTRGVLYTVETDFEIQDPTKRRQRWLLNRGLALLLLLGSPVWALYLIPVGKIYLLGEALMVLIARKDWVGYTGGGHFHADLPALPPAVFGPATGSSVREAAIIRQLNYLYARDYRPADDWRLLWRGLTS